jgi:hypothetical protein
MNVFISHARNDARLARAVTEQLLKHGHKVISAETIAAGSGIREAVQSALNECQAMIVFLNPHSYQSPWVKLEVEHALSDERYKGQLLPVLVGADFESSPKKTPWILTAIKHLALPDPDDLEANAKKVVDEFRKLIAPGATS